MQRTRGMVAIAIGSLFFLAQWNESPAQDNNSDLAKKAIAILAKNCHQCHGQNGAREGNMDFILDARQLVEKKKIIPGDAKKSKIIKRIVSEEMPPEDEKQRPSKDDLALLIKWVEAGAPAPPLEVARPRPFRATRDVLAAVRDYLRKNVEAQDRQYQRFFTLNDLYNQGAKDDDMALYRAALAKLVNSLSWKHAIVVPQAVDADKTILAIDLRDLDWDNAHLWRAILREYPYGLTHDRIPDERETKELAQEVYDLTLTNLPMVRADWFIATAARPPLYHVLLRTPKNSYDLEAQLKVDVTSNFLRGKLARAGYPKSGISEQHRIVERHPALYGAYWKSYDFKTNLDKGNFFVNPLGPSFRGNPYEHLGFEQAGGEIIFNLPNGLQGYMLVDGKDNRIDAGPIDVVSDKLKTSGTPSIVNGLSCMACHAHGMINVPTDQVRRGSEAKGAALDQVQRLYPEAKVMELWLARDEKRFLDALEQATATFLRQGPDDKRAIKDFKEPIGPIARWYRSQHLNLEEAAAELGLEKKEAARLKGAIEFNRDLDRFGLRPLLQGGTITREVWESRQYTTSPFQEASRVLEMGSPLVVQ